MHRAALTACLIACLTALPACLQRMLGVQDRVSAASPYSIDACMQALADSKSELTHAAMHACDHTAASAAIAVPVWAGSAWCGSQSTTGRMLYPHRIASRECCAHERPLPSLSLACILACVSLHVCPGLPHPSIKNEALAVAACPALPCSAACNKVASWDVQPASSTYDAYLDNNPSADKVPAEKVVGFR